MKLLAILLVTALASVEAHTEFNNIQACGYRLHLQLVAACKKERDLTDLKKLLLPFMPQLREEYESEIQNLNEDPLNPPKEGIAEACCYRSCPYSELVSYCYMAIGFF